MATVYIAEFRTIPSADGSAAQVALQPPLAQQNLTITTAAQLSNAFNTSTKFVELHADSPCSFLFVASNATVTAAATTNQRMATDETRVYGVPEGRGFKVSVVSNS